MLSPITRIISSRRAASAVTRLALIGITLTGCGAAQSPDANLKFGVASYSLRNFDRSTAIAMIVELGHPFVSIKSFHLPYEGTPAETATARREFEDAGITIIGGGVITLQTDSDAAMRPYFEYAKNAGMPMMIIAPTAATLPRIEQFVKEYDIKVAIHNHGPEDDHFPAPSDALKVIKDMDPRVGLCIDVGHTARTGQDVVQAIAQAGDRVLDIHMKDLTDLSDRNSQVAVGTGIIPIKAILQQLKNMRYTGFVNLEYEIHPDDPLPGMRASFAYLQQVLEELD